MAVDVGYTYLHRQLQLPVPPVARPASVQPVTRVGLGPDHTLAVPAAVAPRSSDPLAHLLFALKHEGTDLLIATEAVRHIDAKRMQAEVHAHPTGQFIRKAGFLWEAVHQQTLRGVQPRGNAVDLFDRALYLTNTATHVPRDARWRVTLNGLGGLAYCPTVRRTPAIEAWLARDVLQEVSTFADQIGPELLDRTLSWAYLGETESSFAIERQAASADKASAFAALLHDAGNPRPLDEDYLVDLQNAAITNPRERAVQFRVEQNWLRSSARGAAGVSYVPPPPELAAELMRYVMALASPATSPQMPTLVRAALVSFGFVLAHPFMDGNGRLSRFLVHHVLGQSGQLPKGFVLPISMAMQRNESHYLRALQTFSLPARAMWRVTWVDEGKYHFDFNGSNALYRYWDATPCVEFLLSMADQALQKDLREETRFLAAYDAARQHVRREVDLRDNILATLLLSAFQNDGIVSKHRRKQFATNVPRTAFEVIERVVKASIAKAGVQQRARSADPQS